MNSIFFFAKLLNCKVLLQLISDKLHVVHNYGHEREYKNHDLMIIMHVSRLEMLYENSAEKMKVSIKDFFSKCVQICRKLRIGHIYWKNR